MINGVVVRLMSDKGYGFIKGEDGLEYFFHRQDYVGYFDDLVAECAARDHVEVVFESVPSQKGPRASNVSISLIP